MREKNRSVNPSKKLPSFRMSSEEFLATLKSSFPNDAEVEIETGNYRDPTRVVLEGWDEIDSSLGLIASPITVKVSGIEVVINEYSARIHFSDRGVDSATMAENLANRLREFVPWYSPLGSIWFFGFFNSTFLVIALNISRLSPPGIWGGIEFIAAILAFSSLFVMWKLDRPKVYFRSRRSFWGRNRDKISLAVIAAAVGVFFTVGMEFVINRDATGNEGPTEGASK